MTTLVSISELANIFNDDVESRRLIHDAICSHGVSLSHAIGFYSVNGPGRYTIEKNAKTQQTNPTRKNIVALS